MLYLQGSHERLTITISLCLLARRKKTKKNLSHVIILFVKHFYPSSHYKINEHNTSPGLIVLFGSSAKHTRFNDAQSSKQNKLCYTRSVKWNEHCLESITKNNDVQQRTGEAGKPLLALSPLCFLDTTKLEYLNVWGGSPDKLRTYN